MSDNSDNFVAVIAIVMIFGMPIAYAIVNRVFAHQERLEMIRRGITPPPDPRLLRKMAKAKWYDPGMYGMNAPYGAQQQQPYAPPPYDPYGYSLYQATRQLRGGIVVTLIGFALLVGLSFIHPGRPGPWLLGGLIPLFVGIAQVILALLSGARLGTFTLGGPQQGSPPPGQSSQAAAPGQPPFGAAGPTMPSGPYGWRPGTTTELERPTPPPDLRH
ncbi:MAG TPA: hypothetical protein VIG51_00750 [Candidatus Baltobacteraceae bacterium]|jgi:hypothetical protein